MIINWQAQKSKMLKPITSELSPADHL